MNNNEFSNLDVLLTSREVANVASLKHFHYNASCISRIEYFQSIDIFEFDKYSRIGA